MEHIKHRKVGGSFGFVQPETEFSVNLALALARQAVLDAAVKRVTVQADALLVELEELPLCFRVRAQAGGRGAARRVEVTECTPLPR